MTTKSKANGAKTNFKAGGPAADAFKKTFDQAVSGYSQFSELGQDNVEALIESANIATRGFEAINQESLSFSKQSLEDGVAVTQAAMGVRSAQEWFEIQSDFTRAAFDNYLEQVNKLTDLVSVTVRDASEPLNTRVNAFVETVQRLRS